MEHIYNACNAIAGAIVAGITGHFFAQFLRDLFGALYMDQDRLQFDPEDAPLGRLTPAVNWVLRQPYIWRLPYGLLVCRFCSDFWWTAIIYGLWYFNPGYASLMLAIGVLHWMRRG